MVLKIYICLIKNNKMEKINGVEEEVHMIKRWRKGTKKGGESCQKRAKKGAKNLDFPMPEKI